MMLYGLLLMVALVWARTVEPSRLYYLLSCLYAPVLTYEQQFGKQSASYENDYEIPEWFLEKEKKDVTTEKKMERLSSEELAKENGNTIAEETVQKERKEECVSVVGEDKKNSKKAFSREQLSDKGFLRSKIFTIDANTNMTDEELDLKNLLDVDLTVKDLKQSNLQDKNNYKILIYHTHGSESFRDSRPGRKEDTIIGVGEYLAQLLEKQYHIPVYHDDTVYDVIDGVNDRSAAYDNAYQSVSKILEQYPSIEVVIDLHRDGVDEDVSLVTNVDGKKTAKIMFLNGVSRSNTNGEIEYLKNPNRQKNLAFSFQMYLKGKELYGDYIRKIYVKSLRFNLHLLPRATLIEAGAQNNSIEEEKNAMEPLAAILNAVLGGENANEMGGENDK